MSAISNAGRRASSRRSSGRRGSAAAKQCKARQRIVLRHCIAPLRHVAGGIRCAIPPYGPCHKGSQAVNGPKLRLGHHKSRHSTSAGPEKRGDASIYACKPRWIKPYTRCSDDRPSSRSQWPRARFLQTVSAISAQSMAAQNTRDVLITAICASGRERLVADSPIGKSHIELF